MGEGAEGRRTPASFALGQAVVWAGAIPVQPPLPLMNEVAVAPGSLPSLAKALESVPEHRRPRGFKAHQPPYPLIPMLLLVLVGVLCGRRGYQGLADWAALCAREHPEVLDVLGFARERQPRTPVAATVFRLLRDLALRPFQEALQGWVQETAARLPASVAGTVGAGVPADQVALDGKTIRGASARRGEVGSVHLVAAYAPALEAVLDQVDSGGKGRELAAAELLLGRLPLQDRVYTGDALFTQREFCQTILEGGGSYLLPVKENQPTLLADLEEAFSPPVPAEGGGAGAAGWAGGGSPAAADAAGRRVERGAGAGAESPARSVGDADALGGALAGPQRLRGLSGGGRSAVAGGGPGLPDPAGGTGAGPAGSLAGSGGSGLCDHGPRASASLGRGTAPSLAGALAHREPGPLGSGCHVGGGRESGAYRPGAGGLGDAPQRGDLPAAATGPVGGCGPAGVGGPAGSGPAALQQAGPSRQADPTRPGSKPTTAH